MTSNKHFYFLKWTKAKIRIWKRRESIWKLKKPNKSFPSGLIYFVSAVACPLSNSKLCHFIWDLTVWNSTIGKCVNKLIWWILFFMDNKWHLFPMLQTKKKIRFKHGFLFKYRHAHSNAFSIFRQTLNALKKIKLSKTLTQWLVTSHVGVQVFFIILLHRSILFFDEEIDFYQFLY